MLKYASIKMIVAVTNLGSVSYVVRNENFNRLLALELFDKAVEKYKAAAGDLKGRQDATDYFLNNCYSVGIDYDNR